MNKKTFVLFSFILLLPAVIFSTYFHTSAQTSSSQAVSLKTGFNFISFTLQPYLSPQKLMELDTKITDIYLYNAAAGSFISASDATLSSIAPAKGYIVKASADTLLNVSGIPAGTLGDISLKSGFNLVGFSKPVNSTTFSSLMNGYSVIKGMYKWNAASGSFMQVVRNASGVVEKLDGVDPSIAAEQSYFINAASDTTINYDGGTIIIGGQAPVIPAIKSLAMIVLSRPSIAAEISSSIDPASNVTVSAVYSDGSSAAVTASWSLKSGGGSLAGSVYTAPASPGTAVLTASYSEGGSVKTADLTISLMTGSYTPGTENIANSLLWKWTDPGSDSVKIESANRIDITVPANRAFNEIYSFNAPRYTKSVTGDFVMYVRGFPNPFVAQSNGLGLVVEDPDASASALAASSATLQYTYTSGIKVASMQMQNVIGTPAFIDLHDIYFKLERAGNKFKGYVRDPNVSEWTQVGEVLMNLPATIDAGIILINQSNPSKFSAYFTDFSIYSLNSAVSSQVSELVLSKAADASTAGAAYDLSLITAAAKYSNGAQKTVTPAWEVLIGSGILSNGKYSVQGTGETAILRASYTENGVSASALLKLSISGGAAQMTYSVLAESVIAQAAAETVISVNGGGLSGDVSCSVIVPANVLPAGAVVTIGKAGSPAPVFRLTELVKVIAPSV
ncbi:MAG TPA: hypothetical protein PK467_05645 [Candidatus Wallbacteria bacterium]|nr:hypothetical protein [Candidatus Wallbacteria bacterium]